MKKFAAYITLTLAAMLGACSNNTLQENFTDIPEELQDCKFYAIKQGLIFVRVVRCPNSSTSATYNVGKQQHTTVTTD